jgi:GGDEF domain-containing protein
VAEPAPRSERSSSARRRRTPRFVLPDDRHDERTAARIEAFLEGSSTRSRRPGPAIDDRDRPRRPHELDTRPDWQAALAHESSRHARYGRPASVLLIDLGGIPGVDVLQRAARSLVDIARVDVRETDRTARFGPASFRMLLTETSARAARNVAIRLDRTFREVNSDWTTAARLRIEIAAPTRGESLQDAVTAAERRLG